MFIKWTAPSNLIANVKNVINSVSYTAFNNEPSIIHSHKRSTEIIIVKQGNGNLVYREQKMPLTLKRLYFVNAGTEHTEQCSTGTEYYVLDINRLAVTDKSNNPLQYIEIGGRAHEALLKILDLFMDNYRSEDYDQLYASALISAAYFKICKLIEKHPEITASTYTNEYSSSVVHACVDYINSHYASVYSVNDLCRLFHVSHNKLISAFNKELGVAPISYIIKTKLKAAENMLKDTDYTVSQISALCGFTSHAYFSKTFKEAFCLTPTQYRKSIAVNQ